MKQIMYAFSKVFTPEGVIRNCGRNACMELIELANKHYPHKTENGCVDEMYYGNCETGIMNVDAMLELKDKLNL